MDDGVRHWSREAFGGGALNRFALISIYLGLCFFFVSGFLEIKHLPIVWCVEWTAYGFQDASHGSEMSLYCLYIHIPADRGQP
ncbi:hypothetical protein GDO81_023352 [Engystomops pustulosus]|uniref:Uncharacterized protein n=1 Tax=Engystomops pustulosus TaxID=76066 RepID=A0AAV6ZSG0_ENGPU|nr:hypothetical protein GDO81_023352 [Engystomops pustulosus]